MSEILYVPSITRLHELLGFDKPKHTLISLVNYTDFAHDRQYYDVKIVCDFYLISCKSPSPAGLKYGRQYYDFEEGSLIFLAPQQVISVEEFNEKVKFPGWALCFHPDLLQGSSLAEKIHDYAFFRYESHEALHLSDEEKQSLEVILKNIQKEYEGNTDTFSQSMMVTALDMLFHYCQRFYGRQFITRHSAQKDVISQFEKLLREYFSLGKAEEKGLPQVSYFADKLHYSSGYLSDLREAETGKTVKEYIHLHVAELAKMKLLNSNDSINEIAYELGFEYPQYFNKFFRSKTGFTPNSFRKSAG
jgi:AraC-like DNA-binding protein